MARRHRHVLRRLGSGQESIHCSRPPIAKGPGESGHPPRLSILIPIQSSRVCVVLASPSVVWLSHRCSPVQTPLYVDSEVDGCGGIFEPEIFLLGSFVRYVTSNDTVDW